MNRVIAVFTTILVTFVTAAAQDSPELRAAENPPATAVPAGSWTIAGVVLNGKTGAPLDRAEVTIAPVDARASQLSAVETDRSGHFRFSSVPAGKYVLRGSRKGYLISSYQEHEGGFSTAIVTGPGQDTGNLRLELLPSAVIDGVITDDSGEPVRSAMVSLYRRGEVNGEGKIVQSGFDQSDDTGSYEFARLRPGTYYVAVSATPWYAFRPQPKTDSSGNPLPDEAQTRSALDVAYPTTFFANATDSGSATPIQLRAGDRVDANLSLHAVPAVHLRITIPVPDEPGHGFAMPQLEEDVFGNERFLGTGMNINQGMVNSSSHTMIADLGGFAPGHYTLRQFGGQGEQARTAGIDASGDLTVDMGAAAQPGVEISGKIVMASGAKLPSRTTVALRTGQMWASPIQVADDGTFSFPSVSPGPHVLSVRSPGKPLNVLQVAVSTGTAHGDEITVGNEPMLLAATVGSGTASVNGFVMRGNKGFGGAMVVLVPRDPQASKDLYRRDQSDSDGSFVLHNVVPGSYIAIAIANSWSLEWGRPEVLAPYLKNGVALEIMDGQRTVNLPQVLPVQER